MMLAEPAERIGSIFVGTLPAYSDISGNTLGAYQRFLKHCFLKTWVLPDYS
jgi:hypothetical protein